MKTNKKLKVFEVCVSYNVEEDTAAKALDKVLGCSPVTPLSMSVEPLEYEPADDDD